MMAARLDGPGQLGRSVVGLLVVLTCALAGRATPALEASNAVPTPGALPCSASSLPSPSLPYYAIEMVNTRRVPGTGRSRGIGQASFARSPFGVSITRDGICIYDLTFSFERLKPPRRGVYTVWAATSELDQVERLGTLDSDGIVSGRVAWNKFLVILTLEPDDDPAATMWRGPIVSRGMSRSGMMHTLAGHGPYENEPCAKYGFGDNPVRSVGTR